MIVHHDKRAIQIWLMLCLLLVAGMVLVGGYTRLSGSGLSITSWKLVHGVIPPIGEMEWQEEFAAYKATPQYEKINKGMKLDEFKTIFWPEYWHRVLGRTIGFVFLFPFLFFAVRKSMSPAFANRMICIFALGGLQGLVGWIMVKSGLIENPYVSHFKLALHLSIAFFIFALLLWALLDISGKVLTRKPRRPAIKWYKIWFFFLCVQIVFGAFVAGLHAGLMFNTWPLMNGQWLPPEIAAGGLTLENLALVQFIHRKLAVLLVAGFILWWYLNRAYVKDHHLGKGALRVTFVIFIQFILGVATLVHEVPLSLALAHQMVALLLFMTAVMLLHKVTKWEV